MAGELMRGWTCVRWAAGTVFAVMVTIAALLAIPGRSTADEPAANQLTSSDSSGVLRTVSTSDRRRTTRSSRTSAPTAAPASPAIDLTRRGA